MEPAKQRPNIEPEAPAAGPLGQMSEVTSQRSERRGQKSEAEDTIQDLWNERWPKIDIDESLRLLALPPRSLRVR